MAVLPDASGGRAPIDDSRLCYFMQGPSGTEHFRTFRVLRRFNRANDKFVKRFLVARRRTCKCNFPRRVFSLAGGELALRTFLNRSFTFTQRDFTTDGEERLTGHRGKFVRIYRPGNAT